LELIHKFCISSEKKEKGDDKEIGDGGVGSGDECGGSKFRAGGRKWGGSVREDEALVGDWQTETTNMQKATLRLELTSGGTALLEKFRMEETGSRWR